eukprot:gene8680-17919_t
MIVYRDIISGDEVLSDAFKLVPVLDDDGNEIPGLMQCASMMIKPAGDDVDVGCGNAFGGTSEEDAGPAGETVAMVNNVVTGFQYTETTCGTAVDLKTFLKSYFGAIREHMKSKGKPQEDIKAFMATAPVIATFLIKKFKDLQFFLTASFNPETMVYSIYPEGATAPNFIYIMSGLIAEKF